MTPLRQRMIEDIQLRGLSDNTLSAYVRAVRQLAEHYGKSPDQIAEEELRQYFLYLRNVKCVSPGTFTVVLSAIKFLYRYTLRRTWPTLEMARSSREKRLPVVLSADEVSRVLRCIRCPLSWPKMLIRSTGRVQGRGQSGRTGRPRAETDRSCIRLRAFRWSAGRRA